MNFRSVLEMSCDDAREFFLKGNSYFNFVLPKYFSFNKILQDISLLLKDKKLKDFADFKMLKGLDDLNYTLLANKDGKYSWRPFCIIHPALYVSLVHELTTEDNWSFIIKKFHDFQKIDNSDCISIPVESLSDESDVAAQVKNWSNEVEKRSIELALDYELIAHADIADCYSSIYTHSIPWALHSKEVAKARQKDMNLIGNVIDCRLQNMNFGQTNGIPQGSVLMDFIAEIVLGAIDVALEKKISSHGIKDYQILRFRDDYRIFTNNSVESDLILKLLTETLYEYSLKLNSKKVVQSRSVVSASIKEDKFGSFNLKFVEESNLRNILNLHEFSKKYQNSGSLIRLLSNYYKHLNNSTDIENIVPIMSIVVDIAIDNPRTYPVCSAILSILLSNVDDSREVLLNKIVNKFNKSPNSDYMQIWIQRIAVACKIDIIQNAPLNRCVLGETISIWNNDWISSKELKEMIKCSSIIDGWIKECLTIVIPEEEYDMFNYDE
ncbi:hypothetical protein BALOs_0735 [Halobacteriovorax sp. BALOs_7]|uniref:RNA-directed DNA polymerase n=1 Tax=Halobacteriovorax sp. BALOs_7 TaxID=2109558 RepID=UPI000EB6DA95|nr:RNA-directed DNA polymerase [Halobacteriovorax sp. BALOs_7]AYF43745.1 hypothetical protein BALOs_0735 [Halobacteriovorax sp. BALOs_7]